MILRSLNKLWRFCDKKLPPDKVTTTGAEESKGTPNNKIKEKMIDGNGNQKFPTQISYLRQNAYWAYHFLKRIENCKDKDFPKLRKSLLETKYEELRCNETMNEESHRYMKGYFDFSSKDGPILNKTVFNQQRYKRALSEQMGDRIYYFPTHITQRMFKSFSAAFSYNYLASLRGIGKSFSILLYCSLMNQITKYNIQKKSANIVDNIHLPTRKKFYWTIERKNKQSITNQVQALLEVQKLWKIILNQCDPQFAVKHSAEIKQFEDHIQYAIKQCSKVQSKYKQNSKLKQQIKLIVATNDTFQFKFALRKLQKMYQLIKKFYSENSINMVYVFIDQINTIASIYRQTQNRLRQHKHFSQFGEQQKNDYIKGKVYDQLRLALQSLADVTIHNSSADLQNCYRYSNDVLQPIQSQGGINIKMQFGTGHEKRYPMHIYYDDLVDSESYKETMAEFFLVEFQRKIQGVSQQFLQSQEGKKFQEIVKKWFGNHLQMFKIQPLLINDSFKQIKLPKNQIESFYKEEKLEQQMNNKIFVMIQKNIIMELKEYFTKYLQKANRTSKSKRTFARNRNERQLLLNDHTVFLGTIYMILGDLIKKQSQTKTSIPTNNKQATKQTKEFKIKLKQHIEFKEIVEQYGVRIDKIDEFVGKQLFYVKDNILKSYVGSKILYQTLNAVFANSQNHMLFSNAQFALEMLKLYHSTKGNLHELKILTQFQHCEYVKLHYKSQSSTNQQIQFKNSEQHQLFIPFAGLQSATTQNYSFAKFKQILKNQDTRENPIKDKYFDFCIPAPLQVIEQIQEQSIDKKQKTTKTKIQTHTNSQATDFILIGKRKIDNKIQRQINFFEIAIGDIRPKIRNFAKLLTKIKQFKKKDANLQKILLQPISSKQQQVKINFFVIGALAEENKIHYKKQILQYAKSQIKSQYKIQNTLTQELKKSMSNLNQNDIKNNQEMQKMISDSNLNIMKNIQILKNFILDFIDKQKSEKQRQIQIKRDEELKNFENNFNKYFGKIAEISFCNQSSNFIQINHHDRIPMGPKSDIITYQLKLKTKKSQKSNKTEQ